MAFSLWEFLPWPVWFLSFSSTFNHKPAIQKNHHKMPTIDNEIRLKTASLTEAGRGLFGADGASVEGAIGMA
jgi:hypothetical protein